MFDLDASAADVYGDLVVERERTGRHLEGFDGLIAAIAKSRGMPIATRNSDDFAGCGIDVTAKGNDGKKDCHCEEWSDEATS